MTSRNFAASSGAGGGATEQDIEDAITTHDAATDPHGDRGYTDTQVAGKPSLSSSAASTSAVGDSATTGVGTTAARADHKHAREAFATPGSSAVGDSAAAGSASTLARSDHRHGREAFGTVTALTSFNTSSANGAAATPSRSDHVHGAPALPDEWTPAAHGLIAWACDPTFPNAGTAPTIGVAALSGLQVRHNATVSTVYLSVSGAGSALANCFVGVYDSAGTLKGSSTDQSANWGTGFKTIALQSSFAVTPGLYWVAILVGTGTTTAPNFHRVSATTTALINVGLTAATARAANAGSSLAALPSTITPASNTLTVAQLWAALG